MDDVLKGIIGLSVLVVLAGIVGAAITGSERAFDLKPFLSILPNRPAPTGGPQPNGPPSVGAAPPGTAPTPPQDLLATCPPNSVDPQVEAVPLARAEQVRQRLAAGQPFTDLIEVQTLLGIPNCNYLSDRTRHYHYLVETGKAITAQQVGDRPEVTITLIHF
ncbi:MAG: hypothetical protein AAGG51_09375 [Cyanobacteria bacterium P01_G01_bin.54]